jgi:hypothetical protein
VVATTKEKFRLMKFKLMEIDKIKRTKLAIETPQDHLTHILR